MTNMNHRNDPEDVVDDNDAFEDDEEYLDSNDVVEVAVLDENDENIPMDDDDDDASFDDEDERIRVDDDDDDVVDNENEVDDNNNATIEPSKELFLNITSHTGAVYSCAIIQKGGVQLPSPLDGMESSVVQQQQSSTLFIATGGGDDCAYLTRFDYNNDHPSTTTTTTTTTVTQKLSYPHSDSVSAVAFGMIQQQQQQHLLAVGGYDGMIVLYDGQTGHCLMDITTDYKTNFAGPTDVEWLTFHKTGTVLLVGSSTDGTVWMYHIVPPTKNNIYYTLNCMQVFVGHASMVASGGFTNDGRWAVTIGNSGTRDDATLRIWNPKTGIAKHTIHLHSGSTSGILAPISTTTNDYYDKAMDDDDDNNTPSYAGLTCLAFGAADESTTGGATVITATASTTAVSSSSTGNSNSKLVLVGSEDGWAYVCHVGTGKVLHAFRHAIDEALYPSSNATMEIDTDNNDNNNVSTMEPLLSVEAVGFCPSNPVWCATGGADGVLKIWDLHNGQCRHLCRYVDPNDTTTTTTSSKKQRAIGGITRLCWLQSPPLGASTVPPPIVFVATTDGMVHVWDARNGSLLRTLQTGGGRATINDMQVLWSTNNNNNRIIVTTASEDHIVRLFQLSLVELLQPKL